MLQCWHEDPARRPTFNQIVKELDAKLTLLSDRVSTVLSLGLVIARRFRVKLSLIGQNVARKRCRGRHTIS